MPPGRNCSLRFQWHTQRISMSPTCLPPPLLPTALHPNIRTFVLSAYKTAAVEAKKLRSLCGSAVKICVAASAQSAGIFVLIRFLHENKSYPHHPARYGSQTAVTKVPTTNYFVSFAYFVVQVFSCLALFLQPIPGTKLTRNSSGMRMEHGLRRRPLPCATSSAHRKDAPLILCTVL